MIGDTGAADYVCTKTIFFDTSRVRYLAEQEKLTSLLSFLIALELS